MSQSSATPSRTAAGDPRNKLGAEQHDAIVQGTSDDAAISKLSAVSLGYFRDDFLPFFLPDTPATRVRRAPLINRGYWARVKAITQCVQEFMEAGEAVDPSASASATPTVAAPAAAAPSSAPASPFHPSPASAAPAPFSTALPSRSIPKQIVSLGAGLDTTYFKLKAAGMHPRLYVECDFPAALARKAEMIRRNPVLREMVARGAPSAGEATNAAASASGASATASSPLALPGAHDYVLAGADMRDLDGFTGALLSAGIDLSLPTLFLSECVLIYMHPDASNAVLAWIARHFTGGSVVLNYEQIRPFDAFGQTMIDNLRARGCDLLGLTAYPTLEAHHDRYRALGFELHAAWDLNEVYRYYLSPLSETKRIERLELFDEMEEWNMLQAHYQISVACKLPAAAAVDTNAETASAAAAAPAPAASSSAASSPASSSVPSSCIDWSHLGLLGRSKSASAAAGPASITVNGRTIMLGGSGVRASKPLVPTAASGSLTSASNKGSLRKPQPAAAAAATTPAAPQPPN